MILVSLSLYSFPVDRGCFSVFHYSFEAYEITAFNFAVCNQIMSDQMGHSTFRGMGR